MRKKYPFKIDITVQSLENDEEGIDNTTEEISKIMDSIWENYPRAEVAKSKHLENGKGIVFEVKG